MRQKTKISINACACGLTCSTLVSAIMRGNVWGGLAVLALLIVNILFFIDSYSDGDE